jgi:acyl-[acyl-carrier-protein]-phospholipid O-acyltransferase/long-chain-fatty-acid--[acyl-carrier-protein] ligase
MNCSKIVDLDEAAFKARPNLKNHLAYESFVALSKKPRRELIVDCTLQRRSMKRGFLLAVSYMMSKRLSTWTDKPRVGILFPPGLGGYIANLAVVLAGKVPVNLNFTLGPASSNACIQKADVDCLLTTARVQQKMPQFPWPESGVVDLVDELRSLPKAKTLALLCGLSLFPARWLAAMLKIPRAGGDAEAALLFTSGSSGAPKGVALSHCNILANCAQVEAVGLLTEKEKMVANLPIFHAFGYTVTLWYPLLYGCPVVALPSPLDIKKTAEVIEAESATVLVGTPTFFKPYLKRVAPELLASVKYVVAGAEKSPAGFADAWEQRFGGMYLEGYGLTETSPVVSISLPRAAVGVPYPGDPTLGHRVGSVGRMLPGQAARILNPDTMEDLPVESTGLLAVKGANVFAGYLDEPALTAEVMKDGWFMTGDLARFDADGFLFIEGRLSRFSKIAGEMVPHGTIEEALTQAYGFGDSDLPVFAVAGRPDEAKGEALVLLAAIDLDMEDMRAKLAAAGMPNLWIPKEIRRVVAIPSLATGKLDLQAIHQLAIAEVSDGGG